MENIHGLKEFEDAFKAKLIGKKLSSISLLNVNPKYFAFVPNRIVVLDGGISFNLDSGETISYCWNKEMELMEMVAAEPNTLLGDLDFYELEEMSKVATETFGEETITAVDFEWNWYQKLDDNFELEDKLYFAPLGMVLHFSNHNSFQLAAIQFAVDQKDMSLSKASYLPEGDMLVSINEIIEINLPEEEV